MGEESDEALAAHLLQDPADLRLEQDDECQHTHIHHAAQNIIDAVELENIRKQQRAQKDEQALQKAGCLGALHQHQDLVQNKDHDADIQKVCQLDHQQISAEDQRQFRKFHFH